jgi:AAA domain
VGADDFPASDRKRRGRPRCGQDPRSWGRGRDVWRRRPSCARHLNGQPATRTLEQEAGVRALNTTRLLAELDRSEVLAPDTVLLVDEAGMVGTRTYQRLAAHVTAAGAKLIGVGDSRQLAEIEAGGAFRAITDRFGAIELPGNRRQVDPGEIRAPAAMRDGDPDASVFFAHQRGRITVAETPAQARDSQLADWWRTVERHPDQQAILVGLTRAQVAELNADAHELMRANGRRWRSRPIARVSRVPGRGSY